MSTERDLTTYEVADVAHDLREVAGMAERDGVREVIVFALLGLSARLERLAR